MHARYLKILTAFFAIFTVGLCGFNWFIDPLGFYKPPEVFGVNFIKDQMWKHDRAIKAWGIKSMEPDGLVLGTSRSAVGITTDHPGWEAEAVYNSSLTASTMFELYRYLQHAYAFNDVKEVVFGLDFMAFNPARANPVSFDESLLKVDVNGNRAPGYPLLSEYRNLMSIPMAKVSLDSLRDNRLPKNADKDNSNYLPNFSSLGVMQPDYFPRSRWMTHRAEALSAITSLIDIWWAPVDDFTLGRKGQESKALHWYRKILRLAYENNTQVYLYFTPAHAYVYETMAAAGLWSTWEDWKIMMIRINDEEAARAGKSPFSVHDFSGYNAITTEVMPELVGPANAAVHYWDILHFKASVGDKVQDVLFGLAEPGEYFGIPVNADNIEKHLRGIRESRTRYQLNNTEEVAALEAQLAASMAEQPQ